jgi:hypothetical protein
LNSLKKELFQRIQQRREKRGNETKVLLTDVSKTNKKNIFVWANNNFFIKNIKKTPKKPKNLKNLKNGQKPQKRAKKGLFWGFLKYMVNRPTFLPSANPA